MSASGQGFGIRSPGGSLPAQRMETNFVHGDTGINLNQPNSGYVRNMFDGGSEGDKGMTMGELDQLLEFGKQAMWTVNPEKKVTNVYKTIDEFFGDEKIERLSILLDGLIAIQNFNPILAIIAPYYQTDARTITYKVWTLNNLPAQQTLNGVEERTNSWEQHQFSVTTRMYGHMMMFPIDVLQALSQNSLIITLSTMQLGLSLAETFVQITLVYFVSHGLVNRYMKEGGYIWKEQHCDMNIIEALDMRMHAAINCGLEYFMKEFEIMRLSLSHNPQRPNETYLLVPLAVALAVGTQPTAEQIRTYEVYRGYTAKMNSFVEATKGIATVAPSTPAYRLTAGGDLVVLTVPIIPISSHMQLPSVLNSYDSVPQFFYSPQRMKTSADVWPEKGMLGIYDLNAPDDYRFIKPSEFMVNCGVWDPATGNFSADYRESVSELNAPFGSKKRMMKMMKRRLKKSGKKKKDESDSDSDGDDDSDGDLMDFDHSVPNHIPDIATYEMLKRIRHLTSSPGQTIDLDDYVGEMPFTYYDEAQKKTRLATHLHSVSEGVCPNSDSIRAGEDIGKLDAEVVEAMVNLLTSVKQLLNLQMNKATAKWLIEQNKPLFDKAGPTTWYQKGKTTFGACPRDAGTMFITKKPEGADVIVGAGMAHMLHLLPSLIRLGDPQSTEFLKPIAEAYKNFTMKLYKSKVLMLSELFQRVPAWLKDQKPGANAITGNLLEGIPMFVWCKDVNDPKNLASRTFLDHESLVTAMTDAKGDSGKEKEISDFDYRLYIIKSLLDAGISDTKKSLPAFAYIVDYIIANNKFGPDSEAQIVAFFKKHVAEVATSVAADKTSSRLSVPYGSSKTLALQSIFATLLGLLLLQIQDGIDNLNYDALVGQVSRMEGGAKSLDAVKLANGLSLKEASGSDEEGYYKTLSDVFAQVFKTEEGGKGHFTRTSIVLSVSSIEQYIDGLVDKELTDDYFLYPGDWRTNYTTPFESDSEDPNTIRQDLTNYLKTFPQTDGYMFIPPGDVKLDEFGLRRKMKKQSQNDYGAGIGLDYASSDSDEEEEALSSKKKGSNSPKTGGSGESSKRSASTIAVDEPDTSKKFSYADAFHGHRRKHPGSQNALIDLDHSTVFSGYLPLVSRHRLEDLAMRYGTGGNPTTMWLTLIYLFMKTDLRTMSQLADSGIWVPFDVVGMRNTINEVASLPLVAGGCAQAIINRPYVQQVGNSVNNNWKMKASIQFAVAPLYTDTIVLLKGAYYVRNIYGLNTKFCKDPKKFKVTLGPDCNSTAEPCLFAMIIPPTYDMGDAFNWNGEMISPLHLSGLAGIEGCSHQKRRCLVIDHFYAKYYGMIKRLIKQAHDTRMDVIKTFYTTENELAYMPDLDAQLRQLNYRCLMRNLIVRGPYAGYDGVDIKSIRTSSGRGAFGDIGIQSKGSGRVHRGRGIFFPALADSLGRSVGISQV